MKKINLGVSNLDHTELDYITLKFLVSGTSSDLAIVGRFGRNTISVARISKHGFYFLELVEIEASRESIFNFLKTAPDLRERIGRKGPVGLAKLIEKNCG